MQIIVNKGSRKTICVPNSLILNRLSAALLSAKLKESGVHISGRQLYTLFRAAKKYKSTHAEWKLVEVQRRGGGVVEIVLI